MDLLVDDDFLDNIISIVPHLEDKIMGIPNISVALPNEEFDPSQNYIAGSKRTEWIPLDY
jgi:hypothetical protein